MEKRKLSAKYKTIKYHKTYIQAARAFVCDEKSLISPSPAGKRYLRPGEVFSVQFEDGTSIEIRVNLCSKVVTYSDAVQTIQKSPEKGWLTLLKN